MYWDPTVQPVTHNDKVLDRLMQQQQQATAAYAKKRRQAAKLRKQQEARRRAVGAAKQMEIIVLPTELSQLGQWDAFKFQKSKASQEEEAQVSEQETAEQREKTNHSALSNLERKSADASNYKTE